MFLMKNGRVQIFMAVKKTESLRMCTQNRKPYDKKERKGVHSILKMAHLRSLTNNCIKIPTFCGLFFSVRFRFVSSSSSFNCLVANHLLGPRLNYTVGLRELSQMTIRRSCFFSFSLFFFSCAVFCSTQPKRSKGKGIKLYLAKKKKERRANYV